VQTYQNQNSTANQRPRTDSRVTIIVVILITSMAGNAGSMLVAECRQPIVAEFDSRPSTDSADIAFVTC